MSFSEACLLTGHELGQTAGCNQVKKSEWQPEESIEPSEIWQGFMEKFVLWSANNLHYASPNRAINFLHEERRLSVDTTQSFLIGWNPKGIYVSKEKLGLVDYDRDQVWLPPGIVIPFADQSGLRRVKIRRFDGKPKYYFVPGSSTVPMLVEGLRQISIIVESELDAILLCQEVGDLSSIVALGSCSIRPDKVTHDYLTASGTILISLDTDDAGAQQAWRWWCVHYPNAKRWPVIMGKDPTEAFAGGLDLRAWVTASTCS